MSYYRAEVKAGGKGDAAAHANYVARLLQYKDLHGPEELEYTISGNLPAWACGNADAYWRAADQYERSNGLTFKEFDLAIPRGLNHQEGIDLVEKFRRENVPDNRAFTLGVHNKLSAFDGKPQRHVHLQVSPRIQDGIDRPPCQFFKRWNAKAPAKGGAQKADEWDKKWLMDIRKNWEVLQNQALERAGLDGRVDCRSYQARGIDRIPEQHWGPAFCAALTPEEKAAIQAERDLKTELAELRGELDAEVPTLMDEIDEVDLRILEEKFEVMKARVEKEKADRAREDAQIVQSAAPAPTSMVDDADYKKRFFAERDASIEPEPPPPADQVHQVHLIEDESDSDDEGEGESDAPR